jgi:magnesium-transporting ATPase (P-type)
MSIVGNGRREVATLAAPPNPLEPEATLFADLRSRHDGLSAREAERRLIEYGPNEIVRRGHAPWWRGVLAQLTHPLALLLWAASVLAWAAGTGILAAAIVAVILLNAGFALLQSVRPTAPSKRWPHFCPSRWPLSAREAVG